jgi:two-component system NtrC family sensor kinase
VAQAVLSNGLPLTLLGQSRLAPLVPHQTALVAAPMQLEQGSTGVLLLGSTTGSFEREHQDLLWMIGCLAAVCFSNAGRHQEVVSAQAQLLHAGKLAAIGQLAAGVAHELNTPLGAIRLCLEGLTRQLTKEPNPGMQRKLDRALMAADQAHQIVDKLLVYSRDDRSEHERVDLHQVVSQTLDLVSAQLQRDKVPVELDLAPVPPVKGSLLELRQVLTNLLMNARDAALSPGATAPNLKIQTRRQDDWVLLKVFDHGPGVAPELVSRIFEPFFTTKPVGRGTGLGLSISHSIAAKHAGALEYESPPEGGACFFLRLPVNGG